MTTKTTTASMFDSIKGALDKAAKSSGYRDLLKLEAGKTYLVRLLPNTKNPEDTFYHYFHHGWKSRVTGQYTSAISPSTWDQKCPISEEYFKLYREAGNDDKLKEVAKLLKRKESWYINVYVIEDPTTPENNGKVKILRFGKQLMKIIENAISGEDANEYGARIFDLSDEGCTFRIKPEKNGDMKGGSDFNIQYTSSRFLAKNAIPNMTDARSEEVLNSLHDLTKIDETKTEAELKKMLAVHFYGQKEEETDDDSSETSSPAMAAVVKKAAAKAAAKTEPKQEKVEDDIDMTPAPNVQPAPAKTASKSVTVSTDDESAIDALLDGLDK